MLPDLSPLIILVGAVPLLLLFVGWMLLMRTRWRVAPLNGRRLVRRETLALDASRRLHLVACGGRELLLLTGGTRDVVVGWVPPNGDPS